MIIKVKATCIALVAFLLALPNPSQAQMVPDEAIMNTLDRLDRISSYGDYDGFDSSYRLQISEAIALCRVTLSTQRDSLTRSIFYYHKGRLELLCKQIDSARLDLETALALDIANYPALERLCVLSYHHLKGYTKRKGLIVASIENWKGKCALDSTEAFQWYYLGMTYALQNQFSGASNNEKIKRCLQKCMLLDSNNGSYIFEYALYIPEDQRLPLLFKALSKEENWLYRSHIIWWYKHRNQHAEILPFIETSIQVYESQYPEYHSFLEDLWGASADAYKLLKDTERYKTSLEKQKYYAGLQGR